MVFSLSHCRCS